LLAGLYPALKIAAFRPTVFLRGNSAERPAGKNRFRKVLIVMQFCFSVIFILVSVFMIRQYKYLKEADLGFNREDVIYIRTTGKAWDHYSLIKADLEALHFVEGVTSASDIPVMIQRGEIDWGERDGEHNRVARILFTDADFLSAFGIGLQEGEYFSRDRDSLNDDYAVVNRSLVELMGWEDPVGQDLYMWGRDLKVLGDITNINFFPFNVEVFGNEALICRYRPVQDYIFIRVQPGTLPGHLSDIQAVFQRHNPGYAFDFNFVNEYKFEMQEGADGVRFVLRLFSILGVIIAAMGLIGLSVYNNNSRIKEVGIRKAMGAHSPLILRFLLSEFMKLVIISNLIALPLAYLILRRLFRIFSYSVDLKFTVFTMVFFLSVLLCLAVVSFHALRTARANPADSLRYE
jgi:putative ABC transport system permease protein